MSQTCVLLSANDCVLMCVCTHSYLGSNRFLISKNLALTLDYLSFNTEFQFFINEFTNKERDSAFCSVCRKVLDILKVRAYLNLTNCVIRSITKVHS